ncbi:MAG: hypothetical protein DYH04_07470 [Nitrospira sp. NTP2]|nr:hypothetical protein [Nitrospira sp. NTP2]RIK56080.1 MAG: hypothetical protein DCC63_18235 [Nitrospira sp.]
MSEGREQLVQIRLAQSITGRTFVISILNINIASARILENVYFPDSEIILKASTAKLAGSGVAMVRG